jgi:hypothetical protein
MQIEFINIKKLFKQKLHLRSNEINLFTGAAKGVPGIDFYVTVLTRPILIRSHNSTVNTMQVQSLFVDTVRNNLLKSSVQK